jgi:hypothetical protein
MKPKPFCLMIFFIVPVILISPNKSPLANRLFSDVPGAAYELWNL